MPETADVVVIGAGVMGASTAFRLAERGLNVTVVEKGVVAGGSTAKSSAIIRQHYSNEITARMALFSLRVFQHFAEIVGGECGFRPTGFLILASADQAAGMQANLALQQAVGIQTRLLTTAELRELAPGLAAAEEVVAAYEPESGYADPVLTTTSFMDAARRLGARVHQQTEVTGLRFQGDRVTGVITTRGEIAAGAVVNTAGPWGARVARMAGLELPLQPCRVQIALFAPPPGHHPIPLVVADFVHAIYHRPETGAMTLVGSIDPAEANDHADPDAYNEYVDTTFVLDTGERLARRFPYMEAGSSRPGYAGIYDVTPDWHPIIDEPIPGSGFFVAVGHSGHGFKLAPAVGVMVADLVTGQKTEGLDPSLFRLARYARNEPVRGRYAYSIAG